MKNDIKLHNFIQKFNLNITVNQFIYFLSLCLFVVIFRLTHDRRKIKS